QLFAQQRYVLIEIVFVYERIRPDLFDEVVFFHCLPGVFDQQEQRVEGFGRERNDTAVPRELTLARLEAKGIELVKVVGGQAHNHLGPAPYGKGGETLPADELSPHPRLSRRQK
ncbi:MAG TPA: hypothetical protein VE961_21435, partial [Pyrinomonadaceae bacterium]|nr:hypothetical protein [Pyrinomonadaceae bacterium]